MGLNKHQEHGTQELMAIFLRRGLQNARDDPTMIQDFKQSMVKEFEMTDLGLLAYFLGLEVKQCSNGIFVSQAKYATEVLKKFAMEDCDLADNPVEYGTGLT